MLLIVGRKGQIIGLFRVKIDNKFLTVSCGKKLTIKLCSFHCNREKLTVSREMAIILNVSLEIYHPTVTLLWTVGSWKTYKILLAGGTGYIRRRLSLIHSQNWLCNSSADSC